MTWEDITKELFEEATGKRYDVIDEKEPRGQSVTYKGIPCTARTCATRLNRLTDENEQLKEENQALRLVVNTFKEQNMKLKLRLKDLGVEYL